MNNARSELLGLINSFQASRAIHVAASLRLADKLSDGPASAPQLAIAARVQPDELLRLMRTLAAIGVLQTMEDGKYALTPVGHFLRTDVAGTCAYMAELFSRPSVWQAWGALQHSIETGQTAFDHVHGRNVWDYRVQNPQEADIFDRAMSAGTKGFAQAVCDVCDFGRFSHVVDIGGGDGVFLAQILERNPGLCGTLFDQPEVIDRALAAQYGESFQGRCKSIGGDFFDSVPKDGDAYLLKWILHDWSDADSIRILEACRKAMRPSARLLVAEFVIGFENTSPDGELMDLTMMVMNGGRERSVQEFCSIFSAAGFELRSVTRTATPLCVLEAS